ncbi:MAG: hypothetical protein IPK23_04230 [Rhizobiales bacterium]|nr:hypothetical protein [Hyphomicrobiales bacterium]
MKPTVANYLERLEQSLQKEGVAAPLQVMQSRGGLTVSSVARMRPIRLFLSGPAGGVVGGKIAGASANTDNIITIDIGGTSADIALISKRKPLIRPEGVIGDYAVRVAMVDVNTIGSEAEASLASKEAAYVSVRSRPAPSPVPPVTTAAARMQPSVTLPLF